jgi:serine protease Do
MWTIRDVKNTYDNMNISFNDISDRRRSNVWVTVGCFFTLAAVVYAMRSCASWFGPDWHWRNGAPAEARSGRAETVVANTGSDTDVALFAALERLERQMAAAIARARESVVALEYTAPDAPPGNRRIATGVVINNRGEVLSVRIDPPSESHASVVTGKTSWIVAQDFSGRRYSVHWVAADPETGLTLLRLPPRAVRPIRSASGAPNLGSQVFVVGNPFGMGHSVSRGHVAGLDRALELGARQLGGLIQVQAPLYPGDSGAAVVNLHGDWLGLIRSGLAMPGSDSGLQSRPSAPVALTKSSSGLSPSLVPTDVSLGRPERGTDFGFAIPVQDAVWVADQLRTGRGVDRAYLGVRLEPIPAVGVMAISKSEQRLDPALINSASAPDATQSISVDPEGAMASALEGAILREVLAGTPAWRSGLRPGDSIVELDGQPIRSAHDLNDRLDRIPAQATILLGVDRNRGLRRERLSISLCTARRPEGPRVTEPSSAAPAATTASTRKAGSPSPEFSPGRARVIAPPPMNPEIQARALTLLPSFQPNELRLTLPQAVVERLEKLERRLEKLESFPAGARESAHARDPQISSTRNP